VEIQRRDDWTTRQVEREYRGITDSASGARDAMSVRVSFAAFPRRGVFRMTTGPRRALLVRKLIGENIYPVNFRRFGKEVARLGFFHQSRRHFAI
jgi:hypothetical protein